MNAYLEKIKNLSTSEILASIDNNFYQNITDKNELKKFAQIFAYKYCEERNISQVYVRFIKMNPGEMGEYGNSNFIVGINANFLKAFEIFKEIQNIDYVFEFCNTIIHELRHHEQILSFGHDIHPVVKNFAVICKSLPNYGFLTNYYTYSCNPIELDARHFAYKTLSSIESFKPYLKSQSYVKIETNGLNNSFLNVVELLNDKDFVKGGEFTNTKKYQANIKNIKSYIKKLAKDNGINIVGGGPSKIFTWQQNLENIKFSGILGAEIAPDFFSNPFTSDFNSQEVEDKVNEEIEIFDEIIFGDPADYDQMLASVKTASVENNDYFEIEVEAE